MTLYQSIPFDTLEPGMEAEIERLCVADDFYVFAQTSGNHNPMHIPEADIDGDGKADPAIAPAMWVGALISAVLGNKLPGPGTVYRAQSLRFHRTVSAGDTVIAGVRLREKRADKVTVFDTWVRTPDGARIVDGVAEVTAPALVTAFDDADVPGLTVQRHVHFDRLLADAEPLSPLPMAVVAPEEPNALGGALLAAEHTLIDPVLVGIAARIHAAAEELGKSLDGFEIVDVPNHKAAAKASVALVGKGRVKALMKGHLHTDLLLSAVLKKEADLRTDRWLSHVFVMDVPGLQNLLLVTDAAINIAPDLKTKVDIVQNAIDVARALGLAEPKVGILSAVETVNPSIPSTLDAAILSKMAERGQIEGGLVDGPLAMDNAIDLNAARTKGIRSLVAGRAEVLVAPNLEAGNMLAKELTFVAHAEAGGMVVGAKCPIVLTSRSDDAKSRLASCAVAALYHAWSEARRGG